MSAMEPAVRKLLESQGFPQTIVDSWEAEGIASLLPIQQDALKANVLDHKSCLVVGPTSSGKTFIGELACAKHVSSIKPCLYLVPFKALAEEKYAEFSQKYAKDEVGATVVISTADRRIFDRAIAKAEFNIAILTYEKLAALLVTHPNIVRQAGVIVVDEIQMLCDDSRGANLELLLTRARQIAPDIQIIGLSAVVSDLNGLDDWLGACVVRSDNRPTKLREGVIDRRGEFRFIEWDGGQRTEGKESLPSPIGKTQDDMAVDLVAKLLEGSKDEQIIVFASSIRATQLLASSIAGRCSLIPAATKTVNALLELEDSESIRALRKTLAHSVAFHNSDLTHDERLSVERGFRTREIRCVVSTSTLSMGVNMPASTVVIPSHLKWTKDAHQGWVQVPIPVAEYRNMSGRAGRYGVAKDEIARSIFVAQSPVEKESLFKTYVKGDFTPVASAFLKRPLDTMLLQTFASKLCNSLDGCFRFLLKTFAARENWSTDSEKTTLQRNISTIVKELEAQGLLRTVDKGNVEATDLGTVCASSGMQISTFISVVGLVKNGSSAVADVALVASLGEDTGPDSVGLTFSGDEHTNRTQRFIKALRDAAKQESSPLTVSHLDGYFALPPYEDARRIKFQAAGVGFASGIPTSRLENEYGTSGGKCRSIGAACTWICDTAAKVAWLQANSDLAKKYEVLADRFQHGCTADALLIAQIPNRLHRGERESLVAAGYSTLQSIIDKDSREIAKTAKVDGRRVKEFQTKIIEIFGEILELERRQLARLTALGKSVKPIEAVYTMKDTLLEQAIEDLLTPPFCSFDVRRITPQREGEADLRLMFPSGQVGIAQVTAKDKATDSVGINKAGAVLQQSPDLNPSVFICFGRPDFLPDAVEKARKHADNGTNYKLIPVSVLAEMYVRFHEGKLSSGRVTEILEELTGLIDVNKL